MINSRDAQSVDFGLGLNSESSYKKTGYTFNNSFPYNYHQAAEVTGKVFFTATQWQELERQKKIFRYIMASVPVPTQLLSPLPLPLPLPLSTQSNRVGGGFRFANGSDPEPWRCRRTDGKKWRCAKDVAPDMKYCERHAHKTKSRSRKLVETQTKVKDCPTALVGVANQQTRCSEGFMKNGTIPVSQSNNQFQLQMQSSTMGSKKDLVSKQYFKNHNQNPYFDHNSYNSLNSSGNDIDAWSSIGGGDECSLTLSMQSGGNEVEFDHESFQMAVGMLRGDRGGGYGDVLKPQHEWLNQGSWADSGVTPGGPLGEALCLGMNSTQNEPYSHGYSYSTTTSSSCEGGSGGGGGHELDFSFVNRHDD